MAYRRARVRKAAVPFLAAMVLVTGPAASTTAPPYPRSMAVNETLARVCERHHRCRFDGGAVFRMPIAYGDLATDYVHLSLAGQRKLARVTCSATFPFG